MAPFISDLYINQYIKPKATSVQSCRENHALNGKFR